MYIIASNGEYEFQCTEARICDLWLSTLQQLGCRLLKFTDLYRLTDFIGKQLSSRQGKKREHLKRGGGRREKTEEGCLLSVEIELLIVRACRRRSRGRRKKKGFLGAYVRHMCISFQASSLRIVSLCVVVLVLFPGALCDGCLMVCWRTFSSFRLLHSLHGRSTLSVLPVCGPVYRQFVVPYCVGGKTSRREVWRSEQLALSFSLSVIGFCLFSCRSLLAKKSWQYRTAYVARRSGISCCAALSRQAVHTSACVCAWVHGYSQVPTHVYAYACVERERVAMYGSACPV